VKTCPKCNELNGENRTDCWKCKAPLPNVISYKKICPKCRLIFTQKAEYCDSCGSRLSVYSDESLSSSNGGCWLYIVSVFSPLIGIILGCIYIARKEDDLGKSLIITSILSSIILPFLGYVLISI